MQIGLVLKKVSDDGVVRREELWITSKLWFVPISKSFSSVLYIEFAIRRGFEGLKMNLLYFLQEH